MFHDHKRLCFNKLLFCLFLCVCTCARVVWCLWCGGLEGMKQQACAGLPLGVLISLHWPGLARQSPLKPMCWQPVGIHRNTHSYTPLSPQPTTTNQQDGIFFLKNAKTVYSENWWSGNKFTPWEHLQSVQSLLWKLLRTVNGYTPGQAWGNNRG